MANQDINNETTPRRGRPRKTEDSNSEEPKVSVFNSQFRESRYWDSHHDSGGAVWGVFIVIAGLILLGNALNIIPWDFWNHVWQFWPVVIVLAGVQIILGNNVISRFVLFLLSLAAFGLIAIWGLKEVNSSLINNVPHSLIDFVNWVEAHRR